MEYPHWPSTERIFADSAILLNFRDPNRGIVNITCFFGGTGYSGTYQGTFGSGEFLIPQFVTTPYARELQLTPTTGNQPTYHLTLHYDLAWSNGSPPFSIPVVANPSRLEGFDILRSADALQGGAWSYVPGP